MNIQELEIKMWNAAKSRDSRAFLEVVDENAVMVWLILLFRILDWVVDMAKKKREHIVFDQMLKTKKSIPCVSIAEMQNTGKVVINLSTNDLKKEYDRICALGIGSKRTEIRYINARNPYYYFSMKDPDDNTIEITGPYAEIGGEWE